MRKSFLSFVMAFIIISAVALFAADKGESLTVSKCSSCHKTEKFCKHLGTKDAAGWTKVIEGMIKKGAKINNDEKKVIADYLSKLAKGAKPVCK